jgi:UDP:flavonoid glycosyltransferase YjiC (YdhE family)
VTTTDAHAPLRVLITLQPGEGHLAPLTGLSRALRDAGHDVVYATSPAFVPRVEAHGERAIGVGLDWLMGDGPVEDVDPTRRVDEQPTYFARLFLRDSALEMASDLLGLVDDLRPDVIVRDSVEFAGAAVAERRGLPLATFDLTFPIDHHVMITTGDVHDDTELDGLRDHVGLPPATDPDWFRGSLRISTFPEGYGRSEADASTVRIRPETAPSSGEAPSWVSDLDGAVYVTLGTVFASAAPEVLAAAAHGAAGTGRPTVVTRGNLTEGDWGPPDAEHVRVERFVPQTQVLERSAAAVVHGGTGTTVGALAHGVPLVIVPLGADHFGHARAVEQAGAGIALDRDGLRPERVTAALQEILGDRSYAAAAAELGRRFAALPGPEHAVGALEELAGTRPFEGSTNGRAAPAPCPPRPAPARIREGFAPTRP